MTWSFLFVLVGAVTVASAIWGIAWQRGRRSGYCEAARDTRREVEQAVVDKAKAELMTDIWRRRALALLYLQSPSHRRGGRR